VPSGLPAQPQDVPCGCAPGPCVGEGCGTAYVTCCESRPCSSPSNCPPSPTPAPKTEWYFTCPSETCGTSCSNIESKTFVTWQTCLRFVGLYGYPPTIMPYGTSAYQECCANNCDATGCVPPVDGDDILTKDPFDMSAYDVPDGGAAYSKCISDLLTADPGQTQETAEDNCKLPGSAYCFYATRPCTLT
jgi:hypothetical protein